VSDTSYCRGRAVRVSLNGMSPRIRFSILSAIAFSICLTSRGFAADAPVDAPKAPSHHHGVPPSLGRALRLGQVDFPSSAHSPEAQADFLEGVLALHAFMYGHAIEKFREARRIEPHFALAYWGEAMAHTFPLWGEESAEGGRAALQALASTPAQREALAGTEREKLYLRAVERLYEQKPREIRFHDYSVAMGELAKRYPSDLNAKCLYALSLLGIINAEEFGYRKRGVTIRKEAIDLLLSVLAASPHHPGALHYLIHALDDPDLATQARPYLAPLKEVAPDSSHLVHMPTHIFQRLGEWDKSVEYNTEAFFEVSKATDFHALTFLHYAYMQVGPSRKADVERALLLMKTATEKTSLAESPDLYMEYEEMKSRQAVELDEWALSDRQLPKRIAYPANPVWGNQVFAFQLYSTGAAAIQNGDATLVEKAFHALDELRREALENSRKALEAGEPGGSERLAYSATTTEIMYDQLKARQALARKDIAGMRQLMENATALEDSLGPPIAELPIPIQPSHELFAELLWQGGQSRAEVEKQQLAGARYLPNRFRSRKLMISLESYEAR
jgi:hypothetical protein